MRGVRDSSILVLSLRRFHSIHLIFGGLSIGKNSHIPQLAILCDFLEEGWPSMDLVGDSLHQALTEQSPAAVHPDQIRPEMRRRFGFLPGSSGQRTAFKLDRLVGRFVDYRLFARGISSRYDMFHIADHSYGHLAHVLPAERCGVFCHDLDAFRCLIEPARDPRPFWFRKLASHVLSGVQKAAVVFYSTATVRDEILAHSLVPAERLVHAPYGVAAEYSPRSCDAGIRGPYLLHVGSCVPRKRVDVLLDVFARVWRQMPELRLVHVGGPFADEHERQIDELGIRDVTKSLIGLTRDQIAEIYSNASLVLLPSDSEGFGLPLIEALACGVRVVASDIPVLREVGGDAVTYCRAGDSDAWAATVLEALASPGSGPSRDALLAQAAKYTWRQHARIIGDAYASLFESSSPNSSSRGDVHT